MAAIQQYGKSAANVLATATRNGLLAASDFVKLLQAAIYNSAAFFQSGVNGVILTVNAERRDDGNYYRDDTAQAGAAWQFTKDSAFVSYTPAGANPVAFSLGTFQLAEVPTTDANGWARVYQSNGKRKWTKRTTVNSGWPAATAWSPMVSVNLPVGVANLAAVRHQKSFFASTWSRVMTIETDSTTASTALTYHGTLAAGPGFWNAINPVVVIDIELTEI